jgi:hypothetical protein
MQQCREGWHREDEPETPEPAVEVDVAPVPVAGDLGAVHLASLTPGVLAEAQAIAAAQGVGLAVAMDVALRPAADETDDAPGVLDGFGSLDVDADAGRGPGRRVRSTARIKGFPDLPKVPMEDRTVGQAYTDEKTGRTFRPSMFITLTLPSYGRVHEGVPVDPATYDYRRAALDSLTFSKLVDRFWKNLRRASGFKVQYFSAIEAQRRLAPHLHAAVRGAIPRKIVRAVAAATYYAAWWPPMDEVVYDGDDVPVWDAATGRYVDPTTGMLLPTWDEAVSDLEDPAHVASFGSQVDVKGLLGGTEDSDRAVRYLCKYLTKNVASTYAGEVPDPAYERHIDRLHDEVLWLPCGPSCSNWLRYGVTPEAPTAGMVPGRCPSRAHDRENLGIGGRRVLVSRQWSGKTLTEHRADRAAVVREALDAAGLTAPDADRYAADTHVLPDGSPRFEWRDPEASVLDYASVIAASLRQAVTWRRQYDLAKQVVAGAGPPVQNPVDSLSAILGRESEGDGSAAVDGCASW